MPLISDRDRQSLTQAFAGLEHGVRLNLKLGVDCPTCEDTRRLVEEVASLSSRIELVVHEDAVATELVPLLEIQGSGADDPEVAGIFYLGIPSGFEFSSLVHDILMVGEGDSGLSSEARLALSRLTHPVHMQVFVTPTCPYCPGAVHLAHQMAFESPFVRAEMVEATEFPELAQRHGVMGVPRTVINQHDFVEGGVPESSAA